MIPPDSYGPIETMEELKVQSQRTVEAFGEKKLIYPPLDVTLVHYETKEDYGTDRNRLAAGPIFTQKQGNAFVIHICLELLSGISRIGLQGWLEHEMAYCSLLCHPECYECNFKKEIFPLMPVTGSAESVMREITECLEKGLRHYLAAQTLLKMDRGVAQVHFYLYKLAPNPDDPIKFKKAERFLWVRALMLCRKLADYMPVYLLVKEKLDMSRELHAFWWKIHDYLPSKDREILKTLGDEPAGQDPKQYSKMIIKMFKLIKHHYLLPPKKEKPRFTLQ
jgi:hypothetical protein